jgi:DNA-binding MarR family transcriptional regulator
LTKKEQKMFSPAKPELLEHVGWGLSQAFTAWKAMFARKLSERGYGWIREARGELLQYIDRDGVSQNTLVSRSGLTKQAIQQHLDDLTRDGILERVPDKLDSRKKWVCLTQKGEESRLVANNVKMEIEAELNSLLGQSDFDQLVQSLQIVSRCA